MPSITVNGERCDLEKINQEFMEFVRSANKLGVDLDIRITPALGSQPVRLIPRVSRKAASKKAMGGGSHLSAERKKTLMKLLRLAMRYDSFTARGFAAKHNVSDPTVRSYMKQINKS